MKFFFYGLIGVLVAGLFLWGRVETKINNGLKEKKIEEIHKKIEELKEMKIGYEGKAARLENKAQRLQFEEGELQTAKKMWRGAEMNREAAKKVQEEIDRLEMEKKRILSTE